MVNERFPFHSIQMNKYLGHQREFSWIHNRQLSWIEWKPKWALCIKLRYKTKKKLISNVVKPELIQHKRFFNLTMRFRKEVININNKTGGHTSET